jgi:hypothetical protein
MIGGVLGAGTVMICGGAVIAYAPMPAATLSSYNLIRPYPPRHYVVQRS